jgi:diguanylate cyclase (GGDEF)-like protein
MVAEPWPTRATAEPSVKSEALARVLAEFAERLVQGFEIQQILDHLVQRIVEILPVTGAGVMLMGPSGDLHFAAASNEEILQVETLQNLLAEGPCLEAFRGGEPVAVPDLEADDRFPLFSQGARATGLAAVFAFPMSIDGKRFGAMDLYRDTPGDLDEPAMEAAKVLTNVAAAYLHYAHDRAAIADSLDQVRHQSLHDPLTGLPNRTLLSECLEGAVARARRSRNFMAVLFVDLDRFKAINDQHGHLIGDQILIAVAQRIEGTLRGGDTVARLSGDEFVVVCEELNSSEDATLIAEKLAKALSDDLEVDELRVRLTASIGLAFCEAGTLSPDTLLRHADSAMYQAKAAGGARYRVVDHDARVAADRSGDLVRDLSRALADDHLQLAYQPVVGARTRTLAGVEALLRWQHPTRGWVPPDVMLPVAEATGLIWSIGEWVLTRACRDFQRWQRLQPDVVSEVSVNVSSLQVIATDFGATVQRVLELTGMDPSRLCLEVTESVFLADGPRAVSALRYVKELGVRLALDDFGTGYSSLDYLRRFPFDILKIDRIFTSNLSEDQQTRTIVSSVIDLAHGLDLGVVAEGVETSEQFVALTELGTDLVQGYHLCRPLLIGSFERTLVSASTQPILLPLNGESSLLDASPALPAARARTSNGNGHGNGSGNGGKAPVEDPRP